MTVEEAKEYSKQMTYAEAIHNVLAAKCVKYRKATKIKLMELLEIAKKLDSENDSLVRT